MKVEVHYPGRPKWEVGRRDKRFGESGNPVGDKRLSVQESAETIVPTIWGEGSNQ